MRPSAPAQVSLLVVLEALLFLNYPFWDRLTAVSSPLPLTKESALQLGSAVFAAILLCHVGPATLASRSSPPPRLSQMFGAWILLGNLLRMGLLAFRFDGSTPYLVLPVALAVAAVGPLRRIAALVLLVLAPALLLWAIYDKHPGLSQAPAFRREFPVPWGREFVLELLLAAAPAVPLAWLIGRHTASRRAIWLTGMAGIALPMVLSALGSSIAHTAGLKLYPWTKVPGGFLIALLPPAGFEPWVLGAVELFEFCPVFVAAVIIRELLPRGRGVLPALWLVAAAASLGYIGSNSHWEGSVDRLWALSLLLLGLASLPASRLGTRQPPDALL
jgi:hypothetical protein